MKTSCAKYSRLFCVALALLAAAAFCAEDVPDGFKAWGTRGPELPAPPDGWTEVAGEPRAREAPQPSSKDVAAGFIVFQRRPFEQIFHDTVPAAFECGAALRTFAAKGQYENLTLALYALEDLKNVKVSAAALAGPAGKIPANHLDLRLVRPIRAKVSYNDPKDKRFRLAPFYLEKFENFAVSKGKSAQIWITLKVPENAGAGDYEGAVRVQAEGKAGVDVPVRLRVLPFHLGPAPLETAFSCQPNPNPALWEKEMIDQREHGIVAAEAGLGANIVKRNREFGEENIAATRKSIHEALALRKKVFGADANRFPVTADVGHQILFYWNQGKGWFDFWPRSEKMESAFFKAVQVVRDAIQAEDGPPMRLFIMDEPGGHPDLFKETLYYAKLAREKMPRLQSFETIGGGLSLGIDEIGQLGPCIDLLSTNRFNRDICRRLLERKKPYGVYNGGGAAEAVENFVRDRYFFGFYGWKTGAAEILQWVYRFGDPWKEPLRGNHGYTYPANDGPLPSINWESVRAGVDDCRYLDLLWRLITLAKKSADAKAAAAARAGEEMALELMSYIDFGYQGGGTPPAAAGTMEKWRCKIAAQILDLLQYISLEKALAAAPERPGPLEMPFPKEAGADGFGPELIAEGGFENGPGPWKISGKGKGGLDAAEHHSGAKSFKIENAPDAAGTDVAVCVWGWGGEGPTMTLSAGKTYEFSAWVKYRNVPPQLRLNLPAGAAAHEESGEAEDENGWKRLYRRATLARDAKPAYLAVWQQGPGTVWCDDLSLREVRLPPFLIEAPQTLLDDSDKAATVYVKQCGGGNAVAVKLAFDGQKPVSVKVEPNSRTPVDFPVEAFAPGKHELKAELEGGTPFSCTLTFERVRGPFE